MILERSDGDIPEGPVNMTVNGKDIVVSGMNNITFTNPGKLPSGFSKSLLVTL